MNTLGTSEEQLGRPLVTLKNMVNQKLVATEVSSVNRLEEQ